jgi:hypothetical protein
MAKPNPSSLLYLLFGAQKASTGVSYAASFYGTGRFSVFTHRRFGEMFDSHVAKIAACMARFCLLPHTNSASGRQGSDKPLARKKQINIVGQSGEEPEQ